MGSVLDSAGGNVSLIELRDGASSVAIAPDIGGSLAWFRWNHGGEIIDWLRPADEVAQASGDAGAMACFPLVPYSNRVRDGRFAFGGREIQLPVSGQSDPHFEHGHGWRQPWTVVSHEAARAVLRYRHEADAWPWRYEAEQDIRLVDGSLEVRLTLHNLSAEPMPAGFGLHPYFPAMPATRIETEVDAMWETDADVLPTRRVGMQRRSQTIDIASSNLDTVFTGWSRRARIVWPGRDAWLDLEADAPLDFLVLYTPPGEAFFCAEPVSNATDAFNLDAQGTAGTGLIVLAPGDCRTARTRFVPHLKISTQPTKGNHTP
jgi:aldose 1-epimerase